MGHPPSVGGEWEFDGSPGDVICRNWPVTNNLWLRLLVASTRTEGPRVDIERFRDSPVGHLVPISGKDAYLQRDYSHHAFVPRPAPTALALSQGTYNSVAQAHLALGRLDFAV